jgi:Domain of Unknown Function (DUF1080)
MSPAPNDETLRRSWLSSARSLRLRRAHTGAWASLLGGLLVAGCGSASQGPTVTGQDGALGGSSGLGGDGGAGGGSQGQGGVGGTGGADAGAAGQGGGGPAGAGGRGGTPGSTTDAGVDGAPPGTGTLSICPNCKPVFDGASLAGWTQVPAASWSVVDGAMHSLGTARGFLYTAASYGDFRAIVTSRLVSDPANHLPCVLFWGTSTTRDAMSAIQIQPPAGYMWDYRTTGPTANMSPDRYETRFAHPGIVDTQWSQCEMLANRAAGTLRFACCLVTGATPCKATEIVRFTDPTAGAVAPLALQVHNAGMIEEFKDFYVESPVADPSILLTVR